MRSAQIMVGFDNPVAMKTIASLLAKQFKVKIDVGSGMGADGNGLPPNYIYVHNKDKK